MRQMNSPSQVNYRPTSTLTAYFRYCLCLKNFRELLEIYNAHGARELHQRHEFCI
jgi:hypothetical protein